MSDNKPIKGWAKASKEFPILPEDKRTVQFCARWVDKPYERFIVALSKHGFSVADTHLSKLEILDETPIQSGEERWINLSDLKEPIEGIVITLMNNGRVFAYDSEHTMAGLKNVIQHHPEALCLLLRNPKQHGEQKSNAGEERLFTLKEISEFAPWFKKNTAMKDEEGWIPTTFCGMDYKKSYTVEQFYKYFKEKSLLSREQKVNNEK